MCTQLRTLPELSRTPSQALCRPEGFKGGPILVPHYAERRQSLRQLMSFFISPVFPVWCLNKFRYARNTHYFFILFIFYIYIFCTRGDDRATHNNLP